MLHKLKEYRNDIKNALNAFLDDVQHTTFEEEAMERLIAIAKRGKLIRGSLMLHASDSLGERCDPRLAAGYELIHTGILAHDDIIDNDDIRRGVKSIPKQYENTRDPEGIAICVGDIAIVRGIRAMFEVNDVDRHPAILKLLKDVERTGGGQIADITRMKSPSTVTKEALFDVFENKTSHYTLTAPLLVGMYPYIGSDDEEAILKIGKHMGIAFQLRDDYLCYLPEDITGKNQFNDVIENKPTVIRILMEKENQAISNLYGKKRFSDFERNLLEKTFRQVKDTYEKEIQTHKSVAESTLHEMDLPTHFVNDMLELNEFLCTRKH